MASKRSLQDEKLINDLYEKLNWFTFQASGEEFDADQVKAILRLLDTLDPLPETETGNTPAEENPYAPPSDPDAAFERFKQKYHITEEDLAEKDAGNPAAADGDEKIRPFPAEFAEELVPDENSARTAAAAADRNIMAKEEKDSAAIHMPEALDTATDAAAGKERGGKVSSGGAKHRHRGRKRTGKNEHGRFFSGAFGKAAAGLLIVVGATTFLSIGTSAVQQKSFFEIVRDGVNSMKITVTGNEMGMESQSEPTLSLESEEKVYFESWDEVKEENPDILVPGYIPEGLELKELYNQDFKDYLLYRAFYQNKSGDELRIWIQYFEKEYMQIGAENLDDFQLIGEEEDILFYQSDDGFQAFMNKNKGIYTILWKDFEELKRIIYGMNN